jgi:hypothetical protein
MSTSSKKYAVGYEDSGVRGAGSKRSRMDNGPEVFSRFTVLFTGVLLSDSEQL